MPYKDPDRQRQYFRDLYQARKDDPAYREIQRKAGKKYRDSNPEKMRAGYRRWSLKRRFGITIEDFNRMFENQEGLCGICSRHMCNCGEQRGKCASQAEIDHDHAKTGRESVRGLICNACNRGLAAFRDSPAFLRGAISYLETGPSPWIN
jgi:hypothetical protein